MLSAEHVSRRLKLRHLDILLAVVKAGSMAKAAEQLAISQPVVSKAIADLEANLGLRLLDRSTRGVEPTIYGRALVTRSVTVFNDLRACVNELEFLSDPTAGELRIGSSEAVAAGMLGAIIDRLSRQYPKLTFNVTLGGGQGELPELQAHNIDLIIGRLPHSLPDDTQAEVLYREKSFVVAGADSRWSKRRKIELADLMDEPWCLPSLDIFPWSLIADMFRARGLGMPRTVVTARSNQVQNSLLATGRFLTIQPRTILHFNAKNLPLKILPVDVPIRPFPVGITTLKDRTLSPVVKLFVDCAREVARPFAKEV